MQLNFRPQGLLFDLDGTLLNQAKQLQDSTVDLLNHIRQQGIKIGLSTGRRYYFIVDDILPKLDPDDHHVIAEGSEIIDSRGNTLFRKYLPSEIVSKLYETFNNSTTRITFGRDKKYFINNPEYASDQACAHAEIIVPHLTKPNNWETGAMYLGNLTLVQAEQLAKLASEELAGKISVRTFGPQKDNPNLFEFNITAFGVNKCNGAKLWSQLHNIDFSRVVAFGDGDNDVCILEGAGHGVAMRHGVQAARDVAQEVIGGVDTGEFDQYLQQLVAYIHDN